MPWLTVVNVVGVLLIAGLIWFLLSKRNSDGLRVIERKHSGEARLVNRADYVEGMQHLPVVLCLTDSELFYENNDMEAHLDLSRIEEVEYTHELATGKDVPQSTVLRLRSHGHTFEFIIDKSAAEKWVTAFPTHRMDEQAV